MDTRNRARRRGGRVPRVLPGAPPLLLIGAALLFSQTGCNFDRALADESRARAAGPSAEPAYRGLTVEDLPAELSLTDSQRAEMAAALRELRQDRRQIRTAWKDGRRGGRGRADAGAPGDLPPMARFLEAASKCLDTDQFEILADFLSDRRARFAAERGTGPGPGRGCGRGPRELPGEPPSFRDGLLGIAARRLGLSSEQAAALRPVLEDYREGMREIREEFDAGALTAEQARDRSLTLRREAESKARSILTPEQWRRVQEFRDRRRENLSERRAERIGVSCDRRVAFTTRVLGLDEQQAASVRKIYEASIPERRHVHDQVRSGSLEPEEALYAMHEVEKRTDAQVRQILTPDQLRRYDALKELLPRGPHGPRP